LDSTGRIFISKDVIFNESRFPFLELFPSVSAPHQYLSSSTSLKILPTFVPSCSPPGTTINNDSSLVAVLASIVHADPTTSILASGTLSDIALVSASSSLSGFSSP